MKNSAVVISFACWLLSVGCKTTDHRLSTNVPTATAPRDQGYFLLHDLLAQQANLDKLLLIKNERKELRALVKEIASVCAAGAREIESLATQRQLDLKSNVLPRAEIKTRDSIGSARTKELLFSSGQEFEINLLLTQTEALSYGSHLAKVLAELDEGGKKYFQTLSADLQRLYRAVRKELETAYRPGSR